MGVEFTAEQLYSLVQIFKKFSHMIGRGFQLVFSIGPSLNLLAQHRKCECYDQKVQLFLLTEITELGQGALFDFKIRLILVRGVVYGE